MKGQFVFFVSSLVWSVAFGQSQSCTTPLGQRSNCVSIYDCPSFVNALSQKPLPAQVTRFLQQSKCGFSGSVPTVCCGPVPSDNNNNNNQQTNQQSGGPKYQVIQNRVDYLDPVSDEDSSPAPRNTCGIDSSDRIYGGEDTDLDEFPWMALLGYKTKTNLITYQCGGALINNRYVLTAAHCLVGPIQDAVGIIHTIRLGEHNTQTDPDCVENVCADPVQEIPVHMAVAHQEYRDKNRNKRDDIGLIRLARRAQYSYYVKPICLVGQSGRLADGHNVYVAGWGATLQTKHSQVKQKLGVPIFNKDECTNKYRTLNADLTNNQLCAGGGFAQDSCRGDSGGPLMRKRPDGIWETVAIVSFGHGCGRDGWPGVYTSVASYLDWIDTTLRSTNV